jgi:DNA-binding MarR family transcriptional regulator
VSAHSAEPGESPGFLLWRVTLRWQRLITEALRPLDLTHVQFVLLISTWWLGQQGQPPNQVAIAGHAATNIQMTSEILRKLERKGLVVQTTDARDRRARVVVVTEEGARLAERAVGVVEAVDREFFAHAPPSLTPALSLLAEFEEPS